MDDGADVFVRVARPDDAAGIAAAHRTTWQVAYRGIVPDAFLDRIDLDERTRHWERDLEGLTARDVCLVAAAADGTVVGFARGAATRDDDADGRDVAELAAVYVLPHRWSTGVGGRLLAGWRASATAAGFGRATLWTFTANERARKAYRADGWTPDGRTDHRTFVGVDVPCLRFARPLP